jgi:hypothetical protein
LELTAESHAGIVHQKRGKAILDHVLGKLGNGLNRLKIKTADPHCHRRVVACNTVGHCNQVRLIAVDEVQVARPDGEMFRQLLTDAARGPCHHRKAAIELVRK